jgi:UDP-glucose 4-epimerase
MALASNFLRVGVMGAGGYIGRHLAHGLKNRPGLAELRLSVRPGKKEGVAQEAWEIDITERNGIAHFLKELDCVFLMSALSGTTKGFDQYVDYLNTNEVGLFNVLDACRKTNPSCKIIFPSTRLVYKGKPGGLLLEDDPKEPKTPYALNKLACEGALAVYSRAFGIRSAIFRICVPYGQTVDGAGSYGTINHFLTQAKSCGEIRIFGDGVQRRTFTHIQDLTNAMILAGLDPKSDGGIFNIGGADRLSLREAAEKIAKKFDAQVVTMDWPELDKKLETGDTVFDSSSLESLFHCQFQRRFDEWLGES